jgi:hypothetical protein
MSGKHTAPCFQNGSKYQDSIMKLIHRRELDRDKRVSEVVGFVMEISIQVGPSSVTADVQWIWFR